MSPLLVMTPVTMDELKCLYSLWIYENISGRNKTKTAELLGLCRITVRDYIDRGEEMREKILEKVDQPLPGVEFVQVCRPIFVTNQTARCPKCDYTYSGGQTIPACPNGCQESRLERGTEEVFGHYA